MIHTLITVIVVLTAIITTAVIAVIAVATGAARGHGLELGALLTGEMLAGGTSAAVLAGLANRPGATK